MIKTILWDFDGVILDSMKIKGDGFAELFKDCDAEKLSLIKEYHYKNGGISRFDKIRYFYENILEEKITDTKVAELAEKFATIINKKIFNKNNLISETVEFIKQNYGRFNFHIVSGAEHTELNMLCKYFELDKYFISIDGSPTKKTALVKNVLEKYNYRKDEIILIGDAMTDYTASVTNKIKFHGYNNLDLKEFDYIESFKKFFL